MIPILFAENSTTFTTNGIGRLSDALDCVVTEERNGAYELEMTYPMSGIHYEDLAIRKIVVVKPSANATLQAFRIYKLGKPINGRVTVYAQHITYDLSKNVCMPFSVTASSSACNTVLQGLNSNAVETSPFSFWTDVTTVASYSQTVPASIRSRLGGVEGSVLDQFGGEYEWDNFTVKFHRHRGSERDITLRYGKNITDIEQEENIAETVTGVVPYWINTDGTDSRTLSERVVYSSHASAYSSHLTAPLDLSQQWENKPTETQLRTAAQVYVNREGFGVPKVSVKVSFINLADTEEYKDILPLENVNLCDTIKVQFEKLGIDTTAKIVETVYDVLKEKYVSVQVGDLRSNFASTITQMDADLTRAISETGRTVFAQAGSAAQDVVNNATAWLTGSNGYVVAVKNNDGTWKELLFMDDNDTASAHNVLRINENGIGFSRNGVGGPYTNAWTIDGNLVADFITTGLLKSASGENYWDLDTGEFCLTSTAKMRIGQTNYTGVAIPTNSNFPASSWSTDEVRSTHVGETYLASTNDKIYRYTHIGSGLLLTFNNQCATEANYDYVAIFYYKDGHWYESSKFDGGRNGSVPNNIAGKQVYIPTNEFYFYWVSDSSYTAWGYKIDSIISVDENPTGVNYFTQKSADPRPSISWTSINIGSSTLPETSHEYNNNETAGYLMTKSVSSAYDWEEYEPTVGEYINDEVVSNMPDVPELTQEEVFNALTNNGETQGLYLQNGKVYLNGQYLGAGQITIGGSSYNVQPTLLIKDTSNNNIGSWTSDGIVANKGQFGILNIDGSNNQIYVNGTKHIAQDDYYYIGSKGKTIYYQFKPYKAGFRESFTMYADVYLDDPSERGGTEPVIDDDADYSNAGTIYLYLYNDDSDSVRTIYSYTLNSRHKTYTFSGLDWEVGNGNDYYKVRILTRKAALITNETINIYISNVKSPLFSRDAIVGSFIGDLTGNANLDSLNVGCFSYDTDYKGLHGEYTKTGAEVNIRYISSGSTTGLYRIERTYEGNWQNVEWAASDERVKEDIKPLSMELSRKFIEGTHPKEFKYRNTNPLHYGMIAQEARQLLDELGQEDADLEHSMDIPEEMSGIDDQRTIDYHEYIPHLINYVKYLKSEIEELKGRL